MRQRIINGEAVILDKDYIRKNTIGNLPTKRVEESLYEYLEQDLGIKISYGNKDFKIEPVNGEDHEYIDLNGHHHIAVLRSDVYTCLLYTSIERKDMFMLKIGCFKWI